MQENARKVYMVNQKNTVKWTLQQVIGQVCITVSTYIFQQTKIDFYNFRSDPPQFTQIFIRPDPTRGYL